MQLVMPAYSRAQINKAGLAISEKDNSAAEWPDAVEKVNNWRFSHSYPLGVFLPVLKRRAEKIDENSVVTQRVKRFVAVRNKLRREPNMALSQMQDIAGCRAIVHDAECATLLRAAYVKGRSVHELYRTYDYVAEPRASGYRATHLIYKFKSKRKTAFNDLRVEIQIRSVLQHGWAAAVETVGFFTNQALKASRGDARWQRFFALMGTAIALQEESPPVPDTPKTVRALVAELEASAREIRLLDTLNAYDEALRRINETTKGARYFLLHLDPQAKSVAVSGFAKGELAKANNAYAELEATIGPISRSEAVLVTAASLRALQEAYSSFFLKTKPILNLVNHSIEGMRDASNIDLEWVTNPS